jgi:ParB-like chromosome segregation protein Spo0J
MEANARKVFELYRRTDEVPFHKAPEEWLNAIQRFRVPARDFRRRGDEQYLLAAVDAYDPALAALNAFTEMLTAQENTAEPVVEVSVPPVPMKPDVPVETSSPTDGVIDLPVSLLDSHVANPRLKMNERTIEGLTEQMRVNGFDRHHPVLVRKKGDRWEIIGGHHRVAAAITAGLTVVPCQVVEQTDAQAMLSLASDNTHATLTNLEHGLHSFKAEEHGIKVKDYAAQCGLLAPNLSKYRNGARVFLAVRPHLSNDDVIILAKKAEHLAAVGDADPGEWPMMVRACIEETWSLARTRKEVAKLTDFTTEQVSQDVEPEVKKPADKKPAALDIANKKPEPTKPSVAKTTVNATDKAGKDEVAGDVSANPDEQMHYLVIALALKTALANQHAMSPAEMSEVRKTFENFQSDPDMSAVLNCSIGELTKLILQEYGVLGRKSRRAG